MKQILIILAFTMLATIVYAQQFVRKGDTFVEIDEVATKYTYQDKDGTYPIFLNKKGKAFIKKISKKTGKETRRYIHEIGKQINPDAYKDDNEKTKTTKSAKIGFKSGKPTLEFGIKG